MARRASAFAVGWAPRSSSSAGFTNSDAAVPIGLAVDETRQKIYVGKPLGLVSFETESDPLKSCHCPVSQRKSAGSRTTSTGGRASRVASKCCLADQALLRSQWMGCILGKYVRIMVPISENCSFSAEMLFDNGLLWGKSHMRAGHCRNVKNLTFPIEPSATPLRLTLRDGH